MTNRSFSLLRGAILQKPVSDSPGVEPGTFWMQTMCSTHELHARWMYNWNPFGQTRKSGDQPPSSSFTTQAVDCFACGGTGDCQGHHLAASPCLPGCVQLRIQNRGLHIIMTSCTCLGGHGSRLPGQQSASLCRQRGFPSRHCLSPTPRPASGRPPFVR